MTLRSVCAAAFVALLAGGASACPVDATPCAPDVLLTTRDADGRVAAWTAERLRALGVQTWTERRVVERPGAPREEQSIAYQGVRLRPGPRHVRNLCAVRVRRMP